MTILLHTEYCPVSPLPTSILISSLIHSLSCRSLSSYIATFLSLFVLFFLFSVSSSIFLFLSFVSSPRSLLQHVCIPPSSLHPEYILEMPMKLPRITRRKSSGNALEEFENNPQQPSSFRVIERPADGPFHKNFDHDHHPTRPQSSDSFAGKTGRMSHPKSRYVCH